MPAPTGHQGQSGGQYLIGPEYGHEPRLANCGAPRPCRVGPPSRAQFRARLCCGPRSGWTNSSSSCARRRPTRQWSADAAVLPSCCWRQTGMPRDLRLRVWCLRADKVHFDLVFRSQWARGSCNIEKQRYDLGYCRDDIKICRSGHRKIFANISLI